MHTLFLVLGRGVGQVMFQENALSGWLMLVGIACNSWKMALAALLGTAVSTLSAIAFRFDKQAVERGLYGFNGALVGIATVVFLKLSVWLVVLLILGSVLATLITRLFLMQRRMPGYTAPFILTTWLLLIIAYGFIEADLVPPMTQRIVSAPDLTAAFWVGVGQVMFQPSPWAGLLMFLAILVNSRVSAFYLAVGAGLPLMVSLLGSYNYSDFNAGLFAYNAVLCAIALGDRTPAGFGWAGLAVGVSVVLQWAGLQAGLITLTAPFVLATWSVLALRKLLALRQPVVS